MIISSRNNRKNNTGKQCSFARSCSPRSIIIPECGKWLDSLIGKIEYQARGGLLSSTLSQWILLIVIGRTSSTYPAQLGTSLLCTYFSTLLLATEEEYLFIWKKLRGSTHYKQLEGRKVRNWPKRESFHTLRNIEPWKCTRILKHGTGAFVGILTVCELDLLSRSL